MNWIELTHINKDIGKFLVNLDNVSNIFTDKGATRIAYVANNEETDRVEETLEEIRTKLFDLKLFNP